MITNRVSAKLSLRFDVDRLVEAYLETRKWYALATHVAGHDGRSYHDGWQGVSLRANGGRWNFAGPGRPSAAPFRDTEAVANVPYWAEVLRAFPCTKESVRVSVLAAKGRIVPHCDEHIGFHTGRIRLHIPIVTSPAVVMKIDDEICHWQPGEVWFGDFARTHTVTNDGADARAHIIVDAQVNHDLLALFPPEFLSRQGKIAIFPESRSPTAAELAMASCRFVVPRDAAAARLFLENMLPAERSLIESASGDLRAEIGVVDGDPMLSLNDAPAFALEPIGDGRFRLCGWPLCFELRLTAEGPGVKAVAFTGDSIDSTWEISHETGDSRSRQNGSGALRALEG